jgi:F-type H+-transporting ATPase subunit gamma
MSDTMAYLRRKIGDAQDLHSVVRTMKAMAASNIGQYEKSVSSLADCYRTIELGLGACFRKSGLIPMAGDPKKKNPSLKITAVVFGSDQGLVGRFNDDVADYAIHELQGFQGEPKVWAVGERVRARLLEARLSVMGVFDVPNSIRAISPLVGRILSENEAIQNKLQPNELHLYYNRPSAGSVYTPVSQRLLPLDELWQRKLAEKPWPTTRLPEIIGTHHSTLEALIRGYLFISIFRGCAESLASENASRLAAMQRAEKNIDDLLGTLVGNLHSLRQSRIDEELFDVVSGFEALKHKKRQKKNKINSKINGRSL